MSSLASVNGPSITLGFPPEKRTRAPFEVGLSPAMSRSTPAFINSSLYLPIAESSSSLGMTPASVSLLALTIIMNRIGASPLFGGQDLGFLRLQPAESCLYNNVERDPSKSTAAGLFY
jgi:hypothetical protein